MNMQAPDGHPLDEDKTIVTPRKPQEIHICPVCGTDNALEQLQRREYRCGKCNLELAHLDYAPNGTIRGVFGWLLSTGDVVLDRYRIKSVLGKGGFGAAYLVDDLQLGGKRRALKEVPEMMFDEYETSLLSRLDHPAIPDIIERRTANGMVYLSLKFGGSRTLGSERKQYPDRKVPQEKLFPWMRQLCEVLIYLHDQHPPIIHRDLKPDNILLNEDERIMLVDFGIAKEALPESMTRTLGRAATYGFSPPEQVMGTGTDERSDIYALGGTFYALLTGQNPPPAHERVAGAELIAPSHFVADLPPEVEDAITQSLNLNMNQRQRTVKEFAMALGYAEASAVSRPVGTGATRTNQSTPTNTAKSKPSTTTAPGKADLLGKQASQRNAALALSVIVLVAIASGAYFYFFKQPTIPTGSSKPAITDVARPPLPSTVQQIPAERNVPAQPAAPVTSTAVPAPVTTQNPPEQPPVTVPQPTQPVVQTPAAAIPTDTPKEAVTPVPQAHKLEHLPKVQPRERTVPAQPPKPKPKPKPMAKAHTAAPVGRSSPKPSGSPAPSWTIIPGGAHKTD